VGGGERKRKQFVVVVATDVVSEGKQSSKTCLPYQEESSSPTNFILVFGLISIEPSINFYSAEK
jgi:hypothetical protein